MFFVPQLITHTAKAASRALWQSICRTGLSRATVGLPAPRRLLTASLRQPRVRLYLPLFILLGLYTGQRKKAILSLRWTQVDLDNARINFNSPGARRTNKRRARIPIPTRLLPHLRRARLRGTELGFVINDNGVRIRDIKRGFASACQRARLNHVTPHVLRHTCATWLMQRGVTLWDAAGFLGMTLRNPRTGVRTPPSRHLRSAAEALS